ncbi:MAG: methionine--tRNA ligase [Spirochaetota bacterium]
MQKTFYITTPIYYPSNYLHVGHCYTTVAADVMARYKRLTGHDVFFLTGTDEHGEKIATKAKENGLTPQEHVDKINVWIKALWRRLDISYDHFIRTTDDSHKRSVTAIFQKLYDQGDIYKGTYEGLYCVSEEAYFTESQAVKRDGKFFCPSDDCGNELIRRTEEAYFLKLSKYADWLLKYYEEHPEFLEPRERVNEMVNNFLKPGLSDLAVSRTNLSWGIPVPFDPKHTIYVWIDALSNYITGLGYASSDDALFRKFWPADVHLMAKEIVRFHAIIWPITLKMLGVPLPKKIYGHGWILFEGGKMAKSKGNVVDPNVLADRYGIDAIRHFLMREMTFGYDGHYTQEAFLKRFNADLANDLGNLWHRTTTIVESAFGGKLPAFDAKKLTDAERTLVDKALALASSVEEKLEKLQFSDALVAVWDVISEANRYVAGEAPWKMAKDASRTEDLSRVIVTAMETLRIVMTLLSPFLVETAKKVFERMSYTPHWDDARKFGVLAAGTAITRGEPLFARVEIEKELARDAKPEKAASKEKKMEKAPAMDGTITYDDFKKLTLLVAEVLEAKRVEGSEKLIHMTIDIGTEKRSVVGGLYPHYTPETLIGKRVVFLANLAPRKLMGIESQGMVLAAGGETLSLLTPDKDMSIGTRIS